MTADLIVEIGVEEIPAGFLRRALPAFASDFESKLLGSRLDFGAVRSTGTPRRLVAIVEKLMERQRDLEELVVGPPASIAFDDEGAPTKAALGFARKNGASTEDLKRVEVEGRKGEYLAIERRESGRKAVDVLPGLVEELIADIAWPKAMRWGWCEAAFARPVHWIVARYGDEFLDVTFADVRSGRSTRGHRFLANREFELPRGYSAYQAALRESFVVVDRDKRRDMVQAELLRAAGEVGAVMRADEALVDEVTDLVEYPVAVRGEFRSEFLSVPEEVIVSAMRSHQRYFALESDGKLAPHFITISNTVTPDAGVVRRGNEKVLSARLADARFFFIEDRKSTLDEWATRLNGVVFHATLGTIADKTTRVRSIATKFADFVGEDRDAAARVSDLCKADLVTNLVGEFPDLQGAMGRHYAELAGEPDEICLGIEEHYLPRGAGGKLPSSRLGAIVGIADRMDTLVGGFSAGLAPSGSADPYALRRAAVAVVSILLDRGWAIGLGELIGWSIAALEGQIDVDESTQGQVRDFLRVRLRGVLAAGEGTDLAADCIDAALEVGFDDVADAKQRALAVARIRNHENFAAIAAALKRVGNILKGSRIAVDPNPELLCETDEQALWESFVDVDSRVKDCLKRKDYDTALLSLVELKDPVDRFFDSVLVMAEDETIKDNRLALLHAIQTSFTRIADFRVLVN